MTDATQGVPREALDAVIDAAINRLRLADPQLRKLLLTYVPDGQIAHLPSFSKPSDQLTSDVNQLNCAAITAAGRPLAIWLRNAIRQASVYASEEDLKPLRDALVLADPKKSHSTARIESPSMLVLMYHTDRWRTLAPLTPVPKGCPLRFAVKSCDHPSHEAHASALVRALDLSGRPLQVNLFTANPAPGGWRLIPSPVTTLRERLPALTCAWDVSLSLRVDATQKLEARLSERPEPAHQCMGPYTKWLAALDELVSRSISPWIGRSERLAASDASTLGLEPGDEVRIIAGEAGGARFGVHFS